MELSQFFEPHPLAGSRVEAGFQRENELETLGRCPYRLDRRAKRVCSSPSTIEYIDVFLHLVAARIGFDRSSHKTNSAHIVDRPETLLHCRAISWHQDQILRVECATNGH